MTDWSGAMADAMAEAAAAPDHGDVPVGAVVISEGRVIGRGHNRREIDGDPTAHAEILALRQAAEALGTWRLEGCTLVVTLEPCVMCAGAAVQSRLERVVYGAADLAGGAALSLYNVCDDPRLNHRMDVVAGVEAEASAELLQEFFVQRR